MNDKKHLETLRATQAAAWENFHQLKSANESAWAEFKVHMDKITGATVKACWFNPRNGEATATFFR